MLRREQGGGGVGAFYIQGKGQSKFAHLYPISPY